MTQKETLIGLLMCVWLTACDKHEQSHPVGAVSPKQMFLARCSSCHGMNGTGDGPAAMALNPQPRDLGNPEWQSSVTDDQIKKIILEGGAAVGMSSAMPPAVDLSGDPKALAELVAYVRSLKR